MQQFELEYVLHASQKVIYDRLSSASGLSEWFADDVNQKGKIFTFIWEGSEQQAELLMKKDNRLVRFHWLDSDDDDSFFEFKIEIDALTNDLSLIITDYAEEDEVDEGIELWDSQISELKQVLGI
ncbi:SRPBCC domain-containing protein [Labilibaculum sp. A4]|uniref:SRPBCC domain-containing protein n=1 Tax=Labilibaculum euxinus TaxID=2686357 RepID=A0A425YE53_9BACT|nr:START-like domain-containing protein [Labilibaculum euxinus]MDQ1770943.1 START-like domain-containing protein [Labilibaculum euxinus]MUP38840.1 SRPBCC domain-containing protein [Labilibaculum euxinus]MVB08045.1 SRPBCC domain-containing protein [Labilibaculum euxinus]MWN76113.1 SRPBCC domain-containing protein [Labilibaculum euxinus]|eukprot:TRINITY_DN81946_c0_g1_i1.p1 TRINITY_DN81946_c0_g1~~TRINITY_DN81946_c0_g1_i1.p1  ORF type:complete len:125 (+),score=4.30 TRINITY_DN81946_c0_g1_i1:111-485(+)